MCYLSTQVNEFYYLGHTVLLFETYMGDGICTDGFFSLCFLAKLKYVLVIAWF